LPTLNTREAHWHRIVSLLPPWCLIGENINIKQLNQLEDEHTWWEVQDKDEAGAVVVAGAFVIFVKSESDNSLIRVGDSVRSG